MGKRDLHVAKETPVRKSNAGRKPTPPAELIPANFDHQTYGSNQSDAISALTRMDIEEKQRIERAAKEVGYEGSLNPDVIDDAIPYAMARTVEAYVELGKLLIVLKASVDHGDFLPRVERHGLTGRAAQRFMQVARKCAALPEAKRLVAKAGTLTNAIELLALDDEKLIELSRDGETGSIVLDEVESMGASRLRKKVRELDQQLAAQRRLREADQERHDELHSKVYGEKGKEFAISAAQLREVEARKAMMALTLDAQTALLKVGAAFREFENERFSEGFQESIQKDVEYVAQVFEEMLVRCGIPVNFQELVNPSWAANLCGKKGSSTPGEEGSNGKH